jgi:hypothetical protein
MLNNSFCLLNKVSCPFKLKLLKYSSFKNEGKIDSQKESSIASKPCKLGKS